VLLGYEIKSNKQAATITRLREYLHSKDKNGLAEAEKALLRYPNNFDVVHQSAILYYLFGILARDEALLLRSIELLERSILLLGQNTDPEISELSLYSDIAGAYSSLGDEEKSLEILKHNNPCGINNDVIGLSLAGGCNRPDEAVGYLSKSLVDQLASLIRITNGYMNVYFKKNDFASGESILRVMLDFFSALKKPEKSSFLDKSCANFYIALAFAQYKQCKHEQACQSLREAKKLAEYFDHEPDYAVDSIRFVHTAKRHTTFDDLGATATESVLQAVRDMECTELTALWEEICHEG
ncbi:MAG: hypothetical protein J1E65_08700, partial [Lachnospiraceae bacterium]|nr:hypothetical protein [Lachnospiraceae bacterium]